uniref:CCHC-type domain-containing protein n=1 Tax=Myripristis murdjan TaxID=586833 RepID=A0A667YB73_9TELE
MDPADQTPDPARIQQAVAQQGVLLGQHESNIQALYESNCSLSQQLTDLSSQLSAFLSSQLPATPPAPPSEPSLEAPPPRDVCATTPEPFSGQPNLCRGFLFQCTTVFKLRPVSFSTDFSKIQYIFGLLRGRALAWAEAKFSRNPIEEVQFSEFLEDFKLVFDHPDYQANASMRLMTLSQGQRPVADYSIEFWTLAAEVDWTEEALKTAFIKGLSEHMKDELLCRDEPASLSALVSLANRIDNRLKSRRRERIHTSGSSNTRPVPPAPAPGVSSPPPVDEPMQLGRARLSPEERYRRISAGECLYCGKPGHFISSCPANSPGNTPHHAHHTHCVRQP